MAYVCRLLRKASADGLPRVAVTAAAAVLDGSIGQLWAFEPSDFVPHVRLRDGGVLPARAPRRRRSGCSRMPRARRHEVLVNLGGKSPAGFESYARLVEIVSTDGEDRVAARQRWHRYPDRGYPIGSTR